MLPYAPNMDNYQFLLKTASMTKILCSANVIQIAPIEQEYQKEKKSRSQSIKYNLVKNLFVIP